MSTQDKLIEIIGDYVALVHIYANALRDPPRHESLVDLCILRRWIDRQTLTSDLADMLADADELVRNTPYLQAGTERARRDLDKQS